MTITQAIERAFKTLFQQFNIGAETTVRCWHALEADQSWDSDDDRKFPCIDIRCSCPITDENKVTLSAVCSFDIWTNPKDDRSHKQIHDIEEAVQLALDTLYSQFRVDSGSEWITFQTDVITDFPQIAIIGGLDFQSGTEPTSDDMGKNRVGLSMAVHYSRGDY